MIAMIFEYWLNPTHEEEYLQHRATLRELFSQVDGAISIESYQSTSDPDKVLALGFFRDEEAVRIWRNVVEHRKAQKDGRDFIFSDYRLRMAQVSRDYGPQSRAKAPKDSREFQDD